MSRRSAAAAVRSGYRPVSKNKIIKLALLFRPTSAASANQSSHQNLPICPARFFVIARDQNRIEMTTTIMAMRVMTKALRPGPQLSNRMFGGSTG
jgi:hypothetical protein